MKEDNRQTWIVVVAVFVAGCVCAAAASACRAMCRIPYVQLGAAASSPRQAA